MDIYCATSENYFFKVQMANEVKDINMAQNIYFLHVAPHMEGVKVL